MPVITDLPNLITHLPAADRVRFERIFHVEMVEGQVVIPETMRTWTETYLGSLEKVERQRVVRVINKVTWDGALFNPLRGQRPVPMVPMEDRRSSTVNRQSPEADIFADPLRTTAADMFGRVRGEHCITAGNITRWEGQCTVLIFDESDHLAFTREHLRDYFRTSQAWAHKAHEHDPLARYFVWMWNGGLKGGASIPHAHAQIGLGRSMHYSRIEGLRRDALAYRARFNANYFDDLFAAHEDIGLGFSACGLKGFIYLSAARPKDTWILGDVLNDQLADALCEILRGLVDRTNMRAFNVAVLMPPLFSPFPPFSLEGRGGRDEVTQREGEGELEDWSGFPAIIRIADRGSPRMISSDIGALDLFAHNTIAVDPFEVREKLGDGG